MIYLGIYADYLRKFLKLKRPLRAVFDCSNGTTGLVIKKLRNLSAGGGSSSEGEIKKLEIILINDKPDGRFPAHGPDPMKRQATSDLRQAVKKYKADLGVIFDADGDRAFFVDDLGRSVSSGAAADLLSKNFQGPVVVDLVTGYLARELMAADKKKVFDSRVGTFFIKKLMREKNSDFGAEISGHYYFKLDGAYFDSAILAAIHLMNQVSNFKFHDSSFKLSQWIDGLPKYNSSVFNFLVKDKTAVLEKIAERYKKPGIKISWLDGVKVEILAKTWWFNVRPSNTEDLLRLNLEAKDRRVFNCLLQELKKLIMSTH